MYEFDLPKQFKGRLKKFLRKHPDLKIIFKNKLDILQNNPFDPILSIHKLSGKLSGFYCIYVTFEYRIIININEKEQVIELLAIGTHDEVY